MTTPYPSTSLYVGDLNSDVSEGTLFEYFTRTVPVASIRVCRDAVTRRSLGYSYVNFHSTTDAEQALNALNGMPIKGRPCRIMWSQRDPSVRKSGLGNIFIKNLDKSIDHIDLYDTFVSFGNILSCKVATDETGGSKCYGFVHYETKDMAQNAIDRVNGMMLKGKAVYVGHFAPRKERTRVDVNEKFTNVFVKNLDDDVDEKRFVELFAPFGPITSSVLSLDADAKSKCFGFVNFERHEDAVKAIDEMHNKTLKDSGKVLYVGRAQKKSERELEAEQVLKASKYQGVNLYVKNLDDIIDDDRLKSEFGFYGNILSARVMKNEKGVSKGFGFVSYSNTEEATRAVAEMSGRIVGAKPLYVALAQKKDLRRAQLEAQFRQRGKMVVPVGGPNAVPGGAPVGVGANPVSAQGVVGAGPVGAGPGPMGPPLYPSQAIFYTQPPQGAFLGYPPMMAGRQRWDIAPGNAASAGGPQFPSLPPNYMVQMGAPQQQPQQPQQQQQQQPRQPRHQNQRGGGNGGRRGGAGGNYPGARGGRDQSPQQQQQISGPGPLHPGAHLINPATQQQQQQPQQQQQQPQAEAFDPNAPLTTAALANFAPETRQSLIGERLFSLLSLSQPDNAAKITGMFLERHSENEEELLNLCNNPDALADALTEALEVLRTLSTDAPQEEATTEATA